MNLFGSYAKGNETPMSDVDFLISTNVKGLKFYGLAGIGTIPLAMGLSC